MARVARAGFRARLRNGSLRVVLCRAAAVCPPAPAGKDGVELLAVVPEGAPNTSVACRTTNHNTMFGGTATGVAG